MNFNINTMVINVLEYLENSYLKYPQKAAFVDENTLVSYDQLYHFARNAGTAIAAKLNKVRRKPIVVFVDRNVESLVSFMGVAYSGNFYVPIDIQMPLHRIELILKTLEPVACLVPKADIEFSNKVAKDLLKIIYEEAIATMADDDLLNAIKAQTIDMDPLYATFTSGSTGVPKGVLTSQRSVIDMTEALAYTFNFNSSHIFGNQNPFYFDASIKDIYSTLKAGATMYIIPKSCFVSIGTLAPYLNNNKITSILWSAAAIALVSNLKAFDEEKPLYLEHVMFSGEVMHNKVLNYWRKLLPKTLFVNLYGPTEITSVCTYYKIEKNFSDEEPLPIGIPFRNTEIILLNEQNKPVDGNEIGEICVRGTCLALGYYNNPEKTAEAFCQNPLNSSFPEVIYRTGDLARYNEHGEIMFLSRKDNQVKHMGQRVELSEIELFINSLDQIDASICFYDHDKQKIILIYQGKADKKYILDGIKDYLPKYMFPNIIYKLDQLPYNSNGKIDRTLLKEWYRAGKLS